MARLPEFKPHIIGVDYTIEALRKYAKEDKKREAEIKKEYQRLRKITLRRAERLQRSEFAYSKPALTSKSLTRRLKKQSRDIGVRAMSARIQEMNQFLSMRGSTIKGARDVRRETRERLEEAIEYKFKNFREFELFTQFMDYIRAVYKDNFHYMIDEVVDLFSDYAQEVLNNSMSFNQFVDLYQTKYRSEPKELKRPTKFK